MQSTFDFFKGSTQRLVFHKSNNIFTLCWEALTTRSYRKTFFDIIVADRQGFPAGQSLNVSSWRMVKIFQAIKQSQWPNLFSWQQCKKHHFPFHAAFIYLFWVLNNLPLSAQKGEKRLMKSFIKTSGNFICMHVYYVFADKRSLSFLTFVSNTCHANASWHVEIFSFGFMNYLLKCLPYVQKLPVSGKLLLFYVVMKDTASLKMLWTARK